MCDSYSELEIKKRESTNGQLNRRDFAKIVALGSVSSVFPQFAFAQDSLIEKHVTVATPDGECDALFVAPRNGTHPAVVMWPDIKGRRDAFDFMGKRLAHAGYSVLVVNPFYRDVKGAALPEGVSFPSDEAWSILNPMREKLTPQAVVSDTRVFIDYLDQQTQTDTSRDAAVMGYCMSGSYAMYAAAAMPDRIGAIATFHGGGLATDAKDSPHLTIDDSRAEVLHAIAEKDDANHPEMKTLLRKGYALSDLPAIIDVYPNTLHGWTVPDGKAYNEEQAERAWAKMLSLFDRALS